MTDDVKDALNEVRECAANGSDPTTWALNHALAHIDAEAARTAEAVAREREEMREACARQLRCRLLDEAAKLVDGHLGEFARLAAVGQFERAVTDEVDAWAAEKVRVTPLTATPLADELERSWDEIAKMVERAEKAEAERDEAVRALRRLAPEDCDDAVAGYRCNCETCQARAVLAKYPEGA